LFGFTWKNLAVFGLPYRGISVGAGFIPDRIVVLIFANLSGISKADKTGVRRSGGDKPRHYIIEKFYRFLLS
jgi:hypothetical protein